MKHITEEMALDAIYGGWFLGGGGGGFLDGGKAVVKAVMDCGGFDICSIDEIPQDSVVLTGSLVGSPSAGGAGPDADDCRRALQLFKENTDCAIGALIANEAGACSITNGWIAAAASGLPLLDAACNGRAHPTGVMGAMGLDQNPEYKSVQAAVGGRGSTYIELVTRGSTDATSKLVREASVQCRGFVTVVRNPAKASFVKENAALGALSMCMDLGSVIRKNEGSPEKIIAGLKEKLDLEVLSSGPVKNFILECKGGFDVGSFSIGSAEVCFWNEYMTADRYPEKRPAPAAGAASTEEAKDSAVRLATFPDLIMTLDAKSGLPVCSAAVKEGTDLILVKVPKEKLILGRTMFIEKLFVSCEEATGKSIIPYVFGS